MPNLWIWLSTSCKWFENDFIHWQFNQFLNISFSLYRPDLTEPIDVYSAWIDECEALNEE
jgi:hypothetical protein